MYEYHKKLSGNKEYKLFKRIDTVERKLWEHLFGSPPEGRDPNRADKIKEAYKKYKPKPNSMRAAWRRWHKLRNVAIQNNTRLACYFAERLATTFSIPYEDAIQEAMLGLIRAVDMYDHEKPARFGTYAAFWVKQRITRYSAYGPIRAPYAEVGKSKKSREAMRKHEALHGETPDAEKLSELLGCDIRIAKRRLKKLRFVSAEEPAKRGGRFDGPGLLLIDTLRSGDETPDDSIERRDLADKMRSAISRMPRREAVVLQMRFGIGYEPHTLHEIGVVCGVTRERIRQLEMKAMRLLKGVLERNHEDLVEAINGSKE